MASVSAPGSICALCAIAMLAGERSAAADDLAWDAPVGCPDASDARHRIEQRLAADVDTHGIAVAIRRDKAGFVAEIDARAITVASGVRTLRSRRCDELADAVAVVVARLATEAHQHIVVVQPALLAVTSGLTMTVPRPTTLDVVRARPLVSEKRGDEESVWGGGVRALALSGIGSVPHVGLGGELAGFVRRRDAFAELGYARWAESSVYVAPGAPARVDIGLQAVAVRGGWASSRMPLRAWLGAEVGLITGTGVGLRNPSIGAGRWTAIAAGFGVAWPMSEHSRLVGTLEVAGAIGQVTFALADGSEIYQSARASARCALGLELGWR